MICDNECLNRRPEGGHALGRNTLAPHRWEAVERLRDSIDATVAASSQP